MGILFAFFAMIDGWLWQDPYPGYATVSAHRRQAETEYHAAVEEKIGYLKEVQERAIGEIRSERISLRDKRQAIPIILEERRRLAARFESHIAHLQDVGRQLLSTYRTANTAARTGERPAHFDRLGNSMDLTESLSVTRLGRCPRSAFAKVTEP
jgi:hypothetical protein